MKKTVCLLSVLLAMIAWYPLLVIIGWVHHYTVTVRYPIITLLVLTLAFSVVSISLLKDEEKTANAVTSVLSGLLMPASGANLFVWVWENKNFCILALTLVWVAFSIFLMIAYGRQTVFRGVIMGGSSVMLFLVLLVCLLVALFPIGRIRVVQEVPSPEGTYLAQLIDDDQGALGGNTLVEVYDTRKSIDLLFLSVQKNPQRVFFGRWGLFETMQLEWESEQVLLINGRPHEIQ